MTIVVAVRTGAAVVLAADSKLTTQAPAGRNPDGTIRYLPQTYDSAVKIVRDFSETSIAAFAGHGNIGEQNATDYFSRVQAQMYQPPEIQDQRLREIVDEMVVARRDFWTELGLPLDQIPPTIVILAAAPQGATAPRVWRIELIGPEGAITEILKSAGVWFEGSIHMVMTLLYGLTGVQAEALRLELGVDQDVFSKALNSATDSSAIRQINFWTMPLQDAIDFAVFCAKLQVEMERFLPGMAACGGPIDLMAVEMAPRPNILDLPGKALHHPHLG